MSFITRWFLIYAVVFTAALFPGLAAASLHYQADLHQSQWLAAGSRLACRLEHAIPGYGKATFVRAAGKDLAFVLDAERSPQRLAAVAVSSVPPAWRHDGGGEFLGKASPLSGGSSLQLDPDMSRRVLSVLEHGLFPTFTYSSEPGETVTAAVSAVNIQEALGTFKACLAQLLPYDFDAVRISRLLFDFESSGLTADARKRLDQLAEYLELDPTVEKVSIDGHTDSRGRRRYNQGLSERRAQAVRDYLIAKGIDGEKLQLNAFGERKPVASNRNDEGRQANRRVVVVLVK